ncbi:hypothetical protein ABB37_04614 [Leptomonas pyrrhocoris]|uniref:Uncharacterized protein n=1 Tax=Leptomonas pyrrhocoris TaxID=157538 RepID=A0A0N0DVH2_LEPPY|nr:hypothetical protein ABB37_04614 [Leptomonas pyrrhocoris]XP_015658788.1 hypothetical protein ABB37_04614 [Leptomonas pyrrhocoris]KPA80348.1 hypothetical protein ABB37_04614 [Leptomonas pyrrhocoris]KPA80349.1 hypothetical protein ABB37_04614 [Leptomonas pyrrhocoris]|eukprot:XP_015658787.1 hypothetical protein ABB37_04614 [Leptomonas pyrrhocoris]
MTKQQRVTIPPELRAIARAVADADVHQFPDLAPAPGHTRPSLDALRNLTTELNNGVPLTVQEFKFFRAAYAECRQHLHSVTNGAMTSGTPVADVLLLAARMDSLCTDLGVSLLALFPSLREMHSYLLELSDKLAVGRGEGQHHSDVLLDRLVRVVQLILERAEQALRWYESWEAQRGKPMVEQSIVDLMSITTTVAGSPLPSGTSFPTRDASTRRVSVAATDGNIGQLSPAQRRSVVEAGGSFAAAEHNPFSPIAPHRSTITTATATVADAAPPRPLSGKRRLPANVTDALASVNADLDVHFAHLRWYVSVTDRGAVYFDARDYLEENVLRAAWERYVGRNRAACSAEDFFPFLKLFPAWTHPAVLSVVDFKECGVVSVYSLRRLLRVWGPLQLLEVNLRHDIDHGAVDLSQPFAYLAASLASRPDAQVGDYVIGLSDVLGELRVAVLRRARGYHWHQWAGASENTRKFSPTKFAGSQGEGEPESSQTSPTSRKPFSTVSYTLSHDTGAWMVQGLTREEFDSAAEACKAFPEIFQRPRGQLLIGAHSHRLHFGLSAAPGLFPTPVTPTQEFSSPLETVDGNVSALHRACYRNNARYVHTLLDRGGGTVVNSALVDPLVGESFCWTPLLCAVNNPHSDPVDVVRLLLEAGADVQYHDDADCTALYYAIANRYAETTRELMEHCPTLQTSPYTVPLLVAIGAHDCHLRECDIRRLVEVVPSAAVLSVVVAYESDMSLVALASNIVEEKVNGRHYVATNAERRMVAERCAAGAAGADRFTAVEEQRIQEWVAHHTHCCLQARLEVEEAVRVLYAREYVLSWRVWLKFLDCSAEEKRLVTRLAPIYPLGMMHTKPVGHARNVVVAAHLSADPPPRRLGALQQAMRSSADERTFGSSLFRATPTAPSNYVI